MPWVVHERGPGHPRADGDYELQRRCDDEQPLQAANGSNQLIREDKPPVLAVAQPIHPDHQLEIPNQTRQPLKPKSRPQSNQFIIDKRRKEVSHKRNDIASFLYVVACCLITCVCER